MLVLTLWGTFLGAVTISAIARLLAYAGTCAALPVLRLKKDIPKPMFRLKGGIVVAIACLVLIAWLLSNTTMVEARDVRQSRPESDCWSISVTGSNNDRPRSRR